VVAVSNISCYFTQKKNVSLLDSQESFTEVMQCSEQSKQL